MSDPKEKIKRPLRILISNDDGIHAPGIKIMQEIAETLSDDVWVVAPENEQSGAAHSLTLRRPLRIRRVSERRFAVDGTPTDCVMLGVKKVLHDVKPDLVLSGINHGANLGEDITYSGTVAAAMEAALLGIPAVALSLETAYQQPIKWSTPQHFAPQILRSLIDLGWTKDVLININFPNLIANSVKGIKVVKQGLRTTRDDLIEWKDPRGSIFYWIGGVERSNLSTENETDLEAVSQGYIAVTPLHLDLTHGSTMNILRNKLLVKSD